jgi:mono/diheme cytochrome c family protein
LQPRNEIDTMGARGSSVRSFVFPARPEIPMKPTLIVLLLIAVPAVAMVALVYPRIPAAERGRRLAEQTGCFACHGPGGTRGTANPGRTDGSVPTFEGDLMMFAHDADEVREWIRDGVTAKRAESETWRAQRESGALRMPAFGKRLGRRQIDDLVAYVMAVSGGISPEEGSAAALGLERVEALGCTGCHGAGGRLARPNPRSLKGYVPSWDGPDFAELVKSRGEFDEWVNDGISRRFDALPPARFFLKRAVLKMPAYRDHLEPGDLDAMWAYTEWLRGAAAPVGH